MTSPFQRHEEITLGEYVAFDEDVRRGIEVIDGVAFPREQRSRGHQQLGRRMANTLEAAVAKARQDMGSAAPCIEVNTEIEVVLWEVPLNIRIPDVVVHRCVAADEWVTARDVMIAVEVLSKNSQRRDRFHKMADYAKAGIPHYWLVDWDDKGALIIEHYALAGSGDAYLQVGIAHRDRDHPALNLSSPLALWIDWSDLEIGPPA
jgi:Uma2 family endonuclease